MHKQTHFTESKYKSNAKRKIPSKTSIHSLSLIRLFKDKIFFFRWSYLELIGIVRPDNEMPTHCLKRQNPKASKKEKETNM